MAKITDKKSKIIDSDELEKNIDFKKYFNELVQKHFSKKKSLMLIYFYDKVVLLKIEDNSIFYDDISIDSLSNIVEIRLFSSLGEFHLWKYDGIFKWRLRMDEIGDISHVYEENHCIWGTDVDDENYLIEEHRGMKIKFPFMIQKTQIPIKYKVRNYFRYDKDGLIDFYDARLVNIVDKEGRVIYG